jgi:hypothetical protein
MFFYRLKSLLAASLLFSLLGACASVPPHSGYSDFASYAEAVFRHQNQVSSRVIEMNESELIPDSEEYQDAEESMNEACELLNEYAERQGNHENTGWRFKSKVQSSVRGCDASITRLEELLNKLTLPK